MAQDRQNILYEHVTPTCHILSLQNSFCLVCQQGGEGETAPSPAQRAPGARAVMPPASAPTGRRVTLQMDPAPAWQAGRGPCVTSHARLVSV